MKREKDENVGRDGPSDANAELQFLEQEIEALRYALSHDLRAPLRAVLGYAKILEEDYGHVLGADGLDVIGRVMAAGRRMESQVSGLVQLLSLIQAKIEPTEVDLSAMAREIIQKIDRSSEAHKVTWIIEDGIRLTADEPMMTSVLENLLSNAWKFTSDNPSAKVQFGQAVEDGKTCYFVSDNGIGFPTSDAAKIFQPFWKYDERNHRQGVGIGLATVDRIVRRHGGRIWATSEPGKGATFTFTLG